MKKRILPLLLASLLLTACAAETVPDEALPADTTPAETETETVELMEQLYSGIDYEGRDFRIYTFDIDEHFYTQCFSNFHELWAAEATGEILNDAIYNRNCETEEFLNVVIAPVYGGDTNAIKSGLTKAVTAGSTDFDAVFNRMDFFDAPLLAGALYNLKSVAPMDTTHPWWDKMIVDSFTLFDSRLYWISGDFNILDDYAAEAVFFSKKLCDDHDLAYPYDAVREGKWTIDLFFDMAKTVEVDVDGDGALTVGTDVVGHLEQNDHIKHWIYALGEKSVNLNADKTLEVHTLTERHVNVIDKLFALMVDEGMTYTGKTVDFAAGGSLFYGDMIAFINRLRDMEEDFGVVPMPKYDEAQESYGAYVSNGWTTAMALPLTCADVDFTGTCLEVLSATSSDTVRAAVYDVMLTNKLVRDDDSVEMIKIIFACKSYDWAVDFSWGNSFKSAYQALYDTKKNNYVSSSTTKLEAQQKTLQDLIDTISGFQE